MKNLTSLCKHTGVITMALCLTFVANFAYGQWANPDQAPVGGNVQVPLNVGSDSQVKLGNLQLRNNFPHLSFSETDVLSDGNVWHLISNTSGFTNRPSFSVRHDRNGDGTPEGTDYMALELVSGADRTQDYVVFSNQTRAAEYCDRDGNNCVTAAELYSLVNAAPPTPPPPVTYSNCSLDGVVVAHGGSARFYTVESSTSCSSRDAFRTCNDGTLSGSPTYQYSSCRTISTASASCTLDGRTVSHGSSALFFSQSSATNCSSYDAYRTCNDGTLSGSTAYRYSTCTTVPPPPTNQPCLQSGSSYSDGYSCWNAYSTIPTTYNSTYCSNGTWRTTSRTSLRPSGSRCTF